MRYTAASSLVSTPTSSSGGIRRRPPDLAMICSSTAGASLHPHPPPCDRLVSRTVVRGSLSFIIFFRYMKLRNEARTIPPPRHQESQAHQAFAPSLVHVMDELHHASRTQPQRVVVPRSCSHQQQRVEHLVIESCRMPQCVVPTTDRIGETRPEFGLAGEMLTEMRKSE